MNNSVEIDERFFSVYTYRGGNSVLAWIKKHRFAISLGLNIVLLGSGFWSFRSARDARRIAHELESSLAESQHIATTARDRIEDIEGANQKLTELVERERSRREALEERLTSIESRQHRIDDIVATTGGGIDDAIDRGREIADLIAGAERTVFELQTLNQ